jgi:hypothetical protein
MKILVMARADGTLFTRTPAQNPKPGSPEALARIGETEIQTIERISKQNTKGAKLVHVCDHKAIAEGHQHFKGARRWNKVKDCVEVDMALAHVEKMKQIRAARDERLTGLDVETIKALGSGRTGSTVEKRKQALRDLPKTIEAHIKKQKTPQALHEWEPDWPE